MKIRWARRCGLDSKTAIVLIAGVLWAANAAEANTFMALADRDQLLLAIGKWDPKGGWTEIVDFYEPPEPDAAFTIVDWGGRLTPVYVAERRRPSAVRTFSDWTARISRWPWVAQGVDERYALGVRGPLEKAPLQPVVRSLTDPRFVQDASQFLQTRRITLATPSLTQALEADLDGDGAPERLISAHSDTGELDKPEASAVYAFTIVTSGKGGAALPLAAQISWKPRGRLRDEHERSYGQREYYRLIALWDVNEDGRAEIFLYKALKDAAQAEVFDLDAGRLHKRLSAYKNF
jgi:hypothetical protein